MFIRRKRSGNRNYLQLVENKWEDGKTRQRVLRNLGRLEKLLESGELESLVRSGAKFCKNEINYFFSSDETCLSSSQVGRLLQVSPSTVVGWINQGKLEAHRTPGGHRRITVGNLRRFLSDNDMPLPSILEAEETEDEDEQTIFIVDDEPKVIRAISRAFEQHGGPYNVEGCTDGIEALVLIGALQPDLVLLDIFMEGLDGFEVCSRLQKIPHLEGLRIVAMTAHPSEETRERILACGAVDFWVKPVRVEQIVELLQEQQQARVAGAI